MTNINVLDFKSSIMDIGAKKVTSTTNQTNFQETLNNSVKKENEAVDTTDKNTSKQKVDNIKNQKVDNSTKKEIVESKDIQENTFKIKDVEQLDEKIVELVAMALGIDGKVVKEVLESLKLEPNELLNMENLQNLILAVTGNENLIQLLSQSKEITTPITELISEITALAANENVKQVIQAESNLANLTQEKPTQVVSKLPIQNVEKPQNTQAVAKTTTTTATATATTQTNTVAQEVQNTSVTIQNVEEEVNDFADPKGNNQEGKSGSKETVKIVMSSEELLNNLNRSVESLSVNKTENPEQASTTKYVEIVKQIVDQINVTIKANVTTMEMQLNPESLGRLNLMLTSKDGMLKALFTVSDQTVKDALESQMTQLKETLSQQGLKVESIEVKLSTLAYDLNQQRQQQGQPQQKKKSLFNMEDALAVEDEKSFIEGIRKELEIEKSTKVDYIA